MGDYGAPVTNYLWWRAREQLTPWVPGTPGCLVLSSGANGHRPPRVSCSSIGRIKKRPPHEGECDGRGRCQEESTDGPWMSARGDPSCWLPAPISRASSGRAAIRPTPCADRRQVSCVGDDPGPVPASPAAASGPGSVPFGTMAPRSVPAHEVHGLFAVYRSPDRHPSRGEGGNSG